MSRAAVSTARGEAAWEAGLQEIANGLGDLANQGRTIFTSLSVLWCVMLAKIFALDASSGLRVTILLLATVGHFARSAARAQAPSPNTASKPAKAD